MKLHTMVDLLWLLLYTCQEEFHRKALYYSWGGGKFATVSKYNLMDVTPAQICYSLKTTQKATRLWENLQWYPKEKRWWGKNAIACRTLVTMTKLKYFGTNWFTKLVWTIFSFIIPKNILPLTQTWGGPLGWTAVYASQASFNIFILVTIFKIDEDTIVLNGECCDFLRLLSTIIVWSGLTW